ncbi:MAG: DUF1572 family protein [Leptospiraceae bacterium]|nr:DUF1572 family protein [Leptospiraceae bacterium]
MEASKEFLEATIQTFAQQKKLADHALQQLHSDAHFFHDLGPQSHSLAKCVKHVAGNLRSRWSDFLTSDGEKEDRNRDFEFEILETDSREELMRQWEDGWNTLMNSLKALKPDDILKTVTIRKQPHSVILAAQRSLAHTSYHVGQITYLARLQNDGDWNWMTIAPGKSEDFNKQMKENFQK